MWESYVGAAVGRLPGVCVGREILLEKILPGLLSCKGAGRMSPAKAQDVAAVNGNGCSESYKKIGLDHQIGLFQCLAGMCRNHSFGC